MRENSRKLRFETSMSLISCGHVLAKVSHVGRITLRDMSALRVTLNQRNRKTMIRIRLLGFRTRNLPKTHFHENRPHEKNVRHEKLLQARAGCNYMSYKFVTRLH